MKCRPRRLIEHRPRRGLTLHKSAHQHHLRRSADAATLPTRCLSIALKRRKISHPSYCPLRMNPAPNLFLIGPMGAGKTSIGRHLARHLGLRFVDLDLELEARLGASIALTFELEGEAGFRKRESALLGELVRDCGIVLSTGGGAVLDPVNRKLLRARGFVVWLDTDVDTQLNRLHADRQRPLLQGPDRREKLLGMADLRNPLYAQTADLRIAACGLGSSLSMACHVGEQIADTWDYRESKANHD